MAEILSQSQIDDLLNSISSGGDKAIKEISEQNQEKKTKIYDFRMPKKFTKEQLRLLDRIFATYARLLSSYITSLLRIFCKVNVMQIEEQRYYEFSNALPEFALMPIIDFAIQDDDIADTTIIMQISNPITFTMMDRLLGGNGNYVDVSRDFTEIEVGLMTGIMKKFSEMLKEPWSTFIDVNPVMTSIETNSRVIQSIAPEDVIILVLLEVEIRNVKNTVSLCIPAMNLEQIMAKFQEKNTRNSKRFDAVKEAERKVEIMNGIKETPLVIKAILCETQIDLQDILNLQINDVIPLNTSINENVIIKIGEKTWFDGKLGAKNNKKAVKLDNIFKN